jgi:hypothetical protein
MVRLGRGMPEAERGIARRRRPAEAPVGSDSSKLQPRSPIAYPCKAWRLRSSAIVALRDDQPHAEGVLPGGIGTKRMRVIRAARLHS